MEKEIHAGVLTVSTKGSQGRRRDKSGEIAVRMLEGEGISVLKKKVVPDVRERIADTLVEWADISRLALILTTGGTGLSPTDVTPQAMEQVIDYEVPGMAEAMRMESLKVTPHAMISRAMVGVRGSCLIINLPGSPTGVKENLSVILPALKHALSKLGGDTSDCARETLTVK
jgi:molybdenum cofactor synthesis domain-containing protein